MVGYPDVANVRDDFDMIGEVRRGPGWRDRDDDRYSRPITMDKLRSSNLACVRSRTSTRGRRHTRTSCLCLTSSWRRQDWAESSDQPGHPSGGQLPPRPLWTSPTWILLWKHRQGSSRPRAILQEDENGKLKIRWGEDWRRSSHNATVRAWDAPTHHNVEDFVSMAKRMSHQNANIHIFGRDLLNAYQQWPVRQPSHNATFLHTRHDGLTLWFHISPCALEPQRQCGTSTVWRTPCSS